MPRSDVAHVGAASAEVAGTTDKASQELKAVARVRAEAEETRKQVQKVLDEVESFHKEAARVMSQAGRTFAKALALNPEGMRSLASVVKTLDEAIRTERHLRQVTRQQAEEEADWARQRANDAILKAVSAVRNVSNYVHRELDEARRASATAESLRETSQADFKRAQAMMSKTESLVRQEARKLLDQPEGILAEASEETAESLESEVQGMVYQPPATLTASGSEPGRYPRFEADEAPYQTPSSVSIRPDAEKATPPVGDERLSRPVQDVPPAQRPRPTEVVGAEGDTSSLRGQPPIGSGRPELDSVKELESALSAFLSSTAKPDEAPPLELATAPAQTHSEGLFLDNLDFRNKDQMVTESQASPRTPVIPDQNLESAQQPGGSDEASSAETELGEDVLAQLRESLASVAQVEEPRQSPPTGANEGPQVSAPRAASQSVPNQRWQFPPAEPPPASQPSPLMPVEQSYSGILYIVVTPAPDAATLSFFWDVVDSVAGPGKVISQTPLPDGSGHEFTLDLGKDSLVSEQLQKRIPRSEVVALGQDRLRIQFADPMGD